MEYLLRSSGIITLFFVVYKIFLARETFFKANRVYFLVGIFGAIAIPFVSITTYIKPTTTPVLVYSPEMQALLSTPAETKIDWTNWVQYIYACGLAISGLIFLFQLIFLYKKLHHQPFKNLNKFRLIESDTNISPFSFFNYIVYNPLHFSDSERAQLLKHEQTHALQWHSFDTILVQFLICVLWFNPFMWFYKNALIQNLEFLADSQAKLVVNPKNYSYLLLKTALPKYQLALVNNFYKSPLKNRIKMLHKDNSHRINQLKLALILPLLTAFIYIFNTKAVAQETNNQQTIVELSNFSIQLDKNGSAEDFNTIKEQFKSFGYTIKINNIKRNSKNELTGIKIVAHKETKNTQYAVKGTTPINPFKIEYLSDNDEVRISTVNAPITNYNKGYSYKFTEDIESDSVLTKAQSGKIYFKQEHDSLIKFKKNKNGTIIRLDKGNNPQTIIKNANFKANRKDKDGNLTKYIIVKTDKNGGKNEDIKFAIQGEYVTDSIKIIIDGEGVFADSINIIPSELLTTIPQTPTKLAKLNKRPKSTKDLYYFQNAESYPILIVVDGKPMEKEKMEKIKPENIKSVNVLKGILAIKKYGERGRNGVIELITIKPKND